LKALGWIGFLFLFHILIDTHHGSTCNFPTDSDHFHEGNGFMAQHIKITNMFESAVQAVDPSVALPYWDFTIDQAQGETPIDSSLFTSEIFGSMPSAESDVEWGFQSTDAITGGKIPDGRWKNLKADMNEDFPDLNYGYGYLRAPWNMNPSPYISRFSADYQIGISLPSCSQHYEILQTNDLMDFMVSAGRSPES
jgi:Common central domain of tyrosinase